MLSYGGITVLSFANKIVKVQPRKSTHSLYGVPRTLQYFCRFLHQRRLPTRLCLVSDSVEDAFCECVAELVKSVVFADFEDCLGVSVDSSIMSISWFNLFCVSLLRIYHCRSLM